MDLGDKIVTVEKTGRRTVINITISNSDRDGRTIIHTSAYKSHRHNAILIRCCLLFLALIAVIVLVRNVDVLSSTFVHDRCNLAAYDDKDRVLCRIQHYGKQ